MGVIEKLYTAEDLWALSAEQGRDYELSRGRLLEMTPAGALHGEIGSLLGNALFAYVRQHGLGKVYISEVGYRLASDPDTVRAPDVSFVRRADLPAGGSPDSYFPGPPTLAVEIVSPTDRADAIQDKVADYLNAGTALVWVIYPRQKQVMTYTSPTQVRVLAVEDDLTGGDVLPGFTMAVRDVFPE